MDTEKSSSEFTISRARILDAFVQFVSSWESGDGHKLASLTTGHFALFSNVHGQRTGAAAVCSLESDRRHGRLRLESTNQYASAKGATGVLSAYVFGQMSRHASNPLLFGGAVTATLARSAEDWLFSELRIAIYWVEGEPGLPTHWRPPLGKAWQPGDPPPVIVSELDSPWARLPEIGHPIDVADQIAEAFNRYIWSMDHADFALMRTCLTDDIAGEFTPLGRLEGIQAVIGVLKAFRQLWPWMMHYGRVIESEIDGDTAEVIVGGLIPQQSTILDGEDLYGAHYRLSFRKTGAIWRIFWFEYRPGWITMPSK